MRELSLPGRSAVYAGEAMAATSHPLATSTALHILRRGGTAMDAAIAASAVLAVVESPETGIGGDCFALYAPEGQMPPIAFNGSGRAPLAAEIGWYEERAIGKIADDSAHAVTIPGAVDAWWRLHGRFGRLDFAELLQPAIRYAENGYVVHERVAAEWQVAAARLENDSSARSLFLACGRAPEPGTVMRNGALARSLDLIARKGRKGFYEGELAQAMVAHLQSRGGLHTMEDFARTAGEFVEPISIDRGANRIFQMPPNTQGVVALMILRLLDACGAGDLDFLSPEHTHLAIEAAKISYGYRDRLLGDSERSGAILDLLDDKDAIARLAAGILPRRMNPDLPKVAGGSANTVYLAVVDRDRNVASFINSIYHSFGSGICAPGTGILLQNRGVSFRIDRDHPNAIGPGRRPMHTIIPGMVGRDGRAVLSFGVMGGDYQPMGHAHVLTAVQDHGYDLQAACDAPRYLPVSGRVEVERGMDPRTCETLSSWGHELVPAADPLGGAQMISINWDSGTLAAGSDPRKDGCALGY
ncbi:gamma-glutamyltransferase family protein [Pseudaminobacter sp. 19-2017]|uniref:Gamma-glutamyltransferase family protein n=1 Tax=Pseudaminobacter soli (ex Zhang et al. 2022) TaxID=2831468 RepID=A0A942I2B2_9HYPH|nr:gamma-glutamyltransferase family protein [Pseudaminobacter soli]MBS3649382.1 gamma-glutamyltransferase family protein [Pseudaminobacter soli]